MSKTNNIALTDYIDVLNEKANEVNKYEGFYPAKYLIVKDTPTEMIVKVVSTSLNSGNDAAGELIINKLNPYDKKWFAHCAEAQIAVYQAVLDVIGSLNKDGSLYKLEEDNKFHNVSKKTNHNKDIQLEKEMVELSTFDTLVKFKNYSIAEFIKPKDNETIDSIKDKTNALIKTIKDSSDRLKYIDETPNFELTAAIEKDRTFLEVYLNKDKIVKFDINWTKVNEDKAYANLVTLCYLAKAAANTLGCFQQLVGIDNPRLFVSKLFSKKWRITDAGSQYLLCLEISKLIKEVYNFKSIA